MNEAGITNAAPLGFGINLAQNTDALKKFSEMTRSQQRKFIDGAKAIGSEDEMKQYIDSLINIQ